MSKRVTLADVAKKSGVSTYTASLAMRDRSGVAQETRQKVLEMASRMNFRPHVGARSLKNGKTGLIGLMVPNVTDRTLGTLIEQLSMEVKQRGCEMLLELVDENRDLSTRGLDLIASQRVDGLLVGRGTSREADVPKFNRAALDLPIVAFMNDLGPNVDCVDVDRTEGFANAVQYLASRGHKQIGMVGTLQPSEDPSSSRSEKERGFWEGLHRSNQPYNADWNYVVPLLDERGGFEIGCQFAARSNRPTAVITGSVFIATGFIRGLHASGLRVPDDVAVIAYGLDEQVDAICTEVPITTIGIPRERCVRKTVDLLFDRLKEVDQVHHSRQKIVMDSKLVVRKSCGGVVVQ